MSDDFLTVAVPGDADTLVQLKVRLEAAGRIGWIIDGAQLAYPGWVLARVADSYDQTADELRIQLASTWADVRLDEHEVDSGAVVGLSGPTSAAPLHEVAVARTKGLGLEQEAEIEKVRLAEARSGEKSVFARTRPLGGADHELLDVFTTAKGGSVLLRRRGPRMVLHVLRRSTIVSVHAWEPSWTPVGGVQFNEMRSALLGPTVDAAQIAEVLELPPESVAPLRDLMRRESPPLEELCALLELPPEAFRVISGDYAVEQLLGAVIHQPGSEYGWRDLIRSALCLVVFGSGVMRWIDGGSRILGVLAVIGLVLTIKSLVNAWTARHRIA